MRLKELRESKGVKQKEVAKFINKTVQAYSYYERNERKPDPETLSKLAEYFNVPIEYLLSDEPTKSKANHKKGIKIPVLGRVQAGIPVEAIEEIIDYEEIEEDLAKTGEFFGLQIKGDSMYPNILEGDIVIVRQQPDIESGEIGIVLINGQDATVKKVVKHDTGLSLVAFNPAYPPRIFNFEDIKRLPVVILGKVIELRRKF